MDTTSTCSLTGVKRTGSQGATPRIATALRRRRTALPREWIASLMHEATAKGVKVDWVDCGCALDGGEAMLGVRRGSPADFWDMAANSHNMLVVSTP